MNIDDFMKGLTKPEENTVLQGEDLTKLYWFIKNSLDEKIRNEKYWKTSLATLDEQSKKIYQAREQLRVLEKSHIENAKLATIGAMSAGLSHEFNNSLNNLKQGLMALRISIAEKNESQANSLIEDMYEVIRLASETIQSIKGLKNLENKKKILDLRRLVNTICNLYRGNTFDNFTIQNKIPQDLRVEVNELVLYNSLANVIKNAIEASEKVMNKKIIVESLIENDSLFIDISDFGKGISESVGALIFGGYSSKEDGLGYGLKTSKDNLNASGDELELIRPKNPTVFRITLRGKNDLSR